MTRSSTLLLSLAVLTALSARQTQANEIVSTLPGDANNLGAVIGNDGNGHQLAEAAEFSVAPGTSYSLDTITLALADTLPSGGSSVMAILYTNSSGLPGMALDALSSTVASGLPFSGSNTVFNSATHPLLNAGSSYWIAVETTPANSISWLQSATAGTSLTSLDGGTTWASDPTFNAAFRVDGTPSGPLVPEPGTLVLLCSALFGFIGARRLAP